MPQMEVVPFNNPSNVDILNAIRGIATSDFQSRVPAATKANIQDAVQDMWTYSPARNQFIDALVNMIGDRILRYNTWTNPFAKFKRGMLNYGETIEEVAVGLLQAKAYNPDAEYLEQTIFGREPSEVQSRFHRIDRQDMYKLSVNRNLLRRAFLTPNGVSDFMQALMSQITTSDNWDEFLQTTSLFRTYYDNNGFFKIQVPNVADPNSTADDAKYMLRQMRGLADTLPFLSRKYNAAKMPISAQPENLELFITPEAQAAVDVEALAGAFNVGKADFNARTTVVPADYVNIPGFQAMITTREFFIIADQLMDMEQINNPAGIYNNFFWHHHELISASPFVPAILFSNTEATTITVIDYVVTGISALTVTDLIANTTVTNSTVTRGGAYLVAGTAVTSPVGGPNSGLTLNVTGNQSSKTRITQEGVLVIGNDEQSNSLVVTAQATDNNTFETDLTLTVTGSVIEGSVGQFVDDDTTTIASMKQPGITPASGPVGTTFATDNGTWDTKGLTFTYQWNANGTAISGATSDTYTAVSGDAGKNLTVDVTAAKTGLTGATRTSGTATVSAS